MRVRNVLVSILFAKYMSPYTAVYDCRCITINGRKKTISFCNLQCYHGSPRVLQGSDILVPLFQFYSYSVSFLFQAFFLLRRFKMFRACNIASSILYFLLFESTAGLLSFCVPFRSCCTLAQLQVLPVNFTCNFSSSCS